MWPDYIIYEANVSSHKGYAIWEGPFGMVSVKWRYSKWLMIICGNSPELSPVHTGGRWGIGFIKWTICVEVLEEFGQVICHFGP